MRHDTIDARASMREFYRFRERVITIAVGALVYLGWLWLS